MMMLVSLVSVSHFSDIKTLKLLSVSLLLLCHQNHSTFNNAALNISWTIDSQIRMYKRSSALTACLNQDHLARYQSLWVLLYHSMLMISLQDCLKSSVHLLKLIVLLEVRPHTLRTAVIFLIEFFLIDLEFFSIEFFLTCKISFFDFVIFFMLTFFLQRQKDVRLMYCFEI